MYNVYMLLAGAQRHSAPPPKKKAPSGGGGLHGEAPSSIANNEWIRTLSTANPEND